MWVGVDDTDAPGRGCTTWVLSELVRFAFRQGLDLIGPPRLVRLNPNIPWKTRGNAALAARFGHGRGPRSWVGTLDGARAFAYRSGRRPDNAERAAFLEEAWPIVLAAAPDEEGTDPALVVAPEALSPELYWRAVRDVVDPAEVQRTLDAAHASVRVRGEPRGLVGAAAAIAWPARRGTWETIAYRNPERVGTPRSLDAGTVRAAAARERSLFLCHDPRTRRLLVAPHTGCPILYGLRSTDRLAGLRAARTIGSEPVDRTLLFRTNQGTGDHLLPRNAAEIPAFGSAYVRGVVAAPPRVLRGGHVALRLTDRTGGALGCVAFEPTKTLPRAAQRLVPGDAVTVWGGRDRTAVLRLEGLRIERLVPLERLEKPRCPSCRRTTRSRGRLRGFRCPSCGRSFPPEAARSVRLPRTVAVGEVHPTPSARRHLAPRAPEP